MTTIRTYVPGDPQLAWKFEDHLGNLQLEPDHSLAELRERLRDVDYYTDQAETFNVVIIEWIEDDYDGDRELAKVSMEELVHAYVEHVLQAQD